MKKITGLLICILLMHHFSSNAQSFAINTDGSAANASALLDVKSTTKGLLIPRMTKTERNSIAAPATGLMIFQTGPDSIGFHYYSGSSWSWVSSSSNGSDWKLTGNIGTDTATNFIGTTDNMALRFKINNQQAGLISNNNNLIGLGAGKSLGTSTGITAMGIAALGLNKNKNDLVAIGDSALYFNSTGTTLSYQSTKNSAIGFKALKNNTIGWYNTATGYASSYSNTSGIYNAAYGAYALYSNTYGYQNTAIGTEALYFNNGTIGGEGESNTAIGFNSMFYNITGRGNTALGTYSLVQNRIGNNNTAIGWQALWFTKSNDNTAVGFNSLISDTLGSFNTALGDSSNVLNSNLVNATAIGSKSAVNCSNCLVLGSINGINSATSNVNVGIGTTSPDALLHVQRGAVLFDSTIGGTPVSGAGTRMMWIPAKAAFRAGNVLSTQWDNDSIGINSFAVGYSTKAKGDYSFATGDFSTASGFGSTALGWQNIASGSRSFAVGSTNNASGDISVALGASCTSSGSQSFAMGWNSIASGNLATAIGMNAYATGIYSTSIGNGCSATGNTSVSIGNGNISSGSVSTATGYANTASGNYSFATGGRNNTNNFCGFVTGFYNDNTSTGSAVAPVPTNRIFEICKGTAISARSNAMTVLQNGNIGIGTVNPVVPLNFSTALGDKIALWSNGTTHYGFGIQPSLLQVYTESSGNDIAFGYGNSASFSENMRIKGNGDASLKGSLTVQNGMGIIRNISGVQLKKLSVAVAVNVTLAAGATTSINFSWPQAFSAGAIEAYVGNITSGAGGWAEVIMSVINITTAGGTLYINNPRTGSWSPNYTVNIIGIGPQ